MNDGVELGRELLIDGSDRAINRARQAPVEGDRAGKRLLDERLDEFLGAVGLGLLGCSDDLFEKPGASVVVAPGSGATLVSDIA